MKWAFEELSRSQLNTEQVLMKAKERGLMCSKNAFGLPYETRSTADCVLRPVPSISI